MIEQSISIRRRLKLRRILLVIFSVCSILLLCGIFNAVMESENDNETDYINGDVGGNTEVFVIQEKKQKNPREIHWEKKDKNFRLYSAFILVLMMAGAFGADILFVRCPVCGSHISYGRNNTNCNKCSALFVKEENEI